MKHVFRKKCELFLAILLGTLSPSVNASTDTIVICSDWRGADSSTTFKASAKLLEINSKEISTPSEIAKKNIFIDRNRLAWKKSNEFLPYDSGSILNRCCTLEPRELSKTSVTKIELLGYKDGSVRLHLSLQSENIELKKLTDDRDYGEYFKTYKSRGISFHNYKKSLPLFLKKFTDLEIFDASLSTYLLQILDLAEKA